MINIPSSVKVGGLIYDVEIVDELELAYGDTTRGKKRIRIQQADPDFMELVFLHEIVHTFNSEWPEERVHFLAQTLHQFIVENPDVFKEVKKHGMAKKSKSELDTVRE